MYICTNLSPYFRLYVYTINSWSQSRVLLDTLYSCSWKRRNGGERFLRAVDSDVWKPGKLGRVAMEEKSAGTRFQVHVTRRQWESLRRNLRKISVRWGSEKINQPSCCEFRRDRCAPEPLLTAYGVKDSRCTGGNCWNW